MPRYRITVAYDGTDFAGWQLQAGRTTIQGLLEDALFPFGQRRTVVIGAGRTDAGVHAERQIAAFTLDRPVPARAIVRALNARLPPTVRVMKAAEADDGFHPRFDATAKTYRYRIFTGAVLSPFVHRYAWHLPGRLDADAMNEAAALLVGEHDFAAFQAAGSATHTSVRVLDRSIVLGQRLGSYVTYTVRADGFLRHMVRAIVGSLVEVGKGRREPTWIRERLASRKRAGGARTAPPEGLCLVAVDYAPSLAAHR